MKQKKLLKYIVVAILLGVLTGWICHHFFNEGEQLKQIASYFNIVTDIFLRLIKMIIAHWYLPQLCLALYLWVNQLLLVVSRLSQ